MMITTEKRKQYRDRFNKKHPGRQRELWHKWYDKQTIKELTEDKKALHRLIDELESEKRGLFEENKRLAEENQRLQSLCGEARDYLIYCLVDVSSADTILHGLDFIYNRKDAK